MIEHFDADNNIYGLAGKVYRKIKKIGQAILMS